MAINNTSLAIQTTHIIPDDQEELKIKLQEKKRLLKL
jgi:hypothetical protein